MKLFIKKNLTRFILIIIFFCLLVTGAMHTVNKAAKSRSLQRIVTLNTAFSNIIESYSEELDKEIALIKMKEITNNLLIEKPGIFYIVDKKGNLISYANESNTKSQDISNSILVKHIIANPSIETFTGELQNPFSNEYSYTAYHKISGLDCYAVTQVSKAEVNKILLKTFAALYIVILLMLFGIFAFLHFSHLKRKLAESTAHLNATLNALPDMIFEVDLSGTILEYRAPNNDILLAYPNGLVGKQLDEFIPKEYAEKLSFIYGNALDPLTLDNKVYSLEIFSLGFCFEISISVKHNKVKNIKSFIAIVKDITNKKNADIDLLESRNEAERANQAKSEFIAKISHEIRTPLNAIIGLNRILMKDGMSPRQHDYLQKIHYSADNLLHIINDILDFSKYDADKLELLPMEFDLFELVNKNANIFYSEIKDKNLTLQVIISPQIPLGLIGDDNRLGQVLINLMSNAIKFTERGSITLSVNLLDINSEFATLEFKIEDTGIGISNEQKGNLFKPFTQADSSISRKYGGTGLGLSICKRIIEKMDGSIRIDSQLGIGTCISFSIVFKIAEVIHVAHNKAAQLLLVEDNEINILVTQEFFVGSGIQVDVAISGLEALEKLKYKSYDIILMDLHMPNMDGFEATRKIRELELDYYPVIIALTADVDPSIKTTAENSGMNDLLYKPVDPRLLLSTIDKWSKHTNKTVTLHPLTSSGLDPSSPKYLDILELFLENQVDCIPRLYQALEDKDIPTLAALTHTLKGIAGNLGALELFEAAKAFESTLKNNNSDNTELLLSELDRSFDETTTSITKLLKEYRIKKEPSPILDILQLKVKVAELLSYVERNDLSAMDLFDEISTTLANHLSQESNVNLRKALNSLDWDSMKHILDELQQTL